VTRFSSTPDSASCFATKPSFACKRHASMAASETAGISIPTACAASHLAIGRPRSSQIISKAASNPLRV
jgi:hypothetical protein